MTDFAGVAIPVAVTPDVHPVSAPAFAVAGTGEQPIDDFFVPVRGRVLEGGVQLVARGRQTDQVKVYAAHQDGPGGLRPRRETALLVLDRDEGINGIAH